ncbi:LysR family transcriptional regulator [Pararoseomonas sp. SCSIO 73927]|uniref:LysR family transcriptional regulator n=1 Tax=Pararoseomonas sp. SCSIO 73927 TaxID=3114537 RepID=UPI0030D3C876
MDTEDLRTFVEVADAGGVSHAARRLGLSKSIISRGIARLEAELGVQLLARSTRGMALTEAGTAFREYAAKAVADTDQAREAIVPEGELRGRLRVSAPLTFGPKHFAPALAEMARRHPQLHIQTCYTDRFVDLVAEGFDCAIRVGYLQDSNLVARRVGPVTGKLVASPAYLRARGAPATPGEIAGHEALMQGTESWQFLDRGRVVSVRPQGRFKADNGTALVSAALAGIGLGYLPSDFVDEHIESGALIEVMPQHPLPPAGAYVLRPPGQNPSRKIRVLTELLIEHCNPGEQA